MLLTREVQKIDSDCADGDTPNRRKVKKVKEFHPMKEIHSQVDDSSESHGSTTLVDDDEEVEECKVPLQLSQLSISHGTQIATSIASLERSPNTTTEADLEHIHSVLHPQAINTPRSRASYDPALVNNQTIQLNLAFHANCQGRYAGKKLERFKSGGKKDDQNRSSTDGILAMLGVNNQPSQNPKGMHSLEEKVKTFMFQYDRLTIV